jgi:hypothetical protein
MQRATATPDLTPEEEAAVREWFVDRVPDFLWPSYPFDVPPGRMGVVRYLLTVFQAHRHCPRGSCRRARRCLGGDGPPCFRADREELRQILFLIWSHVFHDLPDEAFAAGLDKLGDRYEMLPGDVPVPLPEDLASEGAAVKAGTAGAAARRHRIVACA